MKARTTAATAPGMTFEEWLRPLVWIDGQPLVEVIPPWRQAMLSLFLDARDPETGRLRYSRLAYLAPKKHWKTASAMLCGLKVATTEEDPRGIQVLHVANDEEQARDGQAIARALIRANPSTLGARLTMQRNRIVRNDGRAELLVLPAQDTRGMHGKTFKLLTVDEVHGWGDHSVFEALSPDPTRVDVQVGIFSYMPLVEKDGAPLMDIVKAGRSGVLVKAA